MSKDTLLTLVVVLALFAGAQIYVTAQYEYHNDRLNLALGQCLGVNLIKEKKLEAPKK